MFRRYLFVVCALALTLAVAAAASAAPYYFTALSPVGSYTTAIPYALNTVNGQLEAVGKSGGGYYVTRGGDPVVWSNPTAGGTVAGTNVLSDIPGATAGDRITGIDSNGDLAGYSRNSSSNYLPWYLPAGGNSATLMPTLASGDQVCPYAMNNSQQIVGAEGAEANPGTAGVAGTCQATLWTQSGGSWGVSTLPAIAAGAYAGAAGITNNGIVAGWSNTVTGTLSEENLGYQDAVTWTNSGSGWVTHDLVNRSVYTLGAFGAMAVNSAGAAVGYGQFGGIDPRGGNNAVEFTGSGTVIMLGNLGALGAGNGVVPADTALGINDSGIVVGTATTSSGANDAFIYYPGGGNTMQDMNTVFASSIPAGWSLSYATAIDNKGDIIGTGTNGSSGTQGFMLAPALPGDAILDGKVDINDLTIVLAHYNQTGTTWSQGEFTGSGTVDINDLTIVLAHYNQTFGASAAGNLSAVPEPGALLLLGIGAIGLAGFAWRGRRA